PPLRKLLQYPVFIMAVIAQFLYVAAQTGTNSFFINYVIDAVHDLRTPVGDIMMHLGYFGEFFMPKNNEQAASIILAIGGMGAFWIGRLTGAYIMRFISPRKLLMWYAFANTILVAIVIADIGWLSVFCLFTTYFFMSIMFPTIFALGIQDMVALTKKSYSFLVIAVAGGAFCPSVMGLISVHSNMATRFIIPIFCYVFIAFYAFWLKGKLTS